MKRKSVEVHICTDCAMWCANGDTSGMDVETETRVTEAFDRQSEQGYTVVMGTEFVEFSMSRCDVCRSPLGGSRFEAHLLEW